MGLDITVHQHAELLDPQPDKDDDGRWPDEMYDDESLVLAFCYAGFEQSLAGLAAPTHETVGSTVVAEAKTTFAESGWYRVSGKTFGFRAGSYGGYNQWREALSQAALGVSPDAVWDERDKFCAQPFFELINFADNEGTIGPAASAALARDFDEQRERVMLVWRNTLDEATLDYYARKYEDWSSGCHLAADSGLIVFG